MQLCKANSLVIANTRFEKNVARKVTYRITGVDASQPMQAGDNEQIDCIIVRRRFKNSIVDVESGGFVNLGTDHYPAK